jgi:hypothetical protein
MLSKFNSGVVWCVSLCVGMGWGGWVVGVCVCVVLCVFGVCVVCVCGVVCGCVRVGLGVCGCGQLAIS